jgi:hypothetical protein
MAKPLTPRGKALHFLSTHRGIKEIPPGSNTDDRPNAHDHRNGIRKAQIAAAGGGDWLIGKPWCGVWAGQALRRAHVQNLSWRLASVLLIEQDARARRGPFRGYASPDNWHVVLRGDLAIMFGRGVHVETVRGLVKIKGRRYVITDGGNTSPGVAGSQSDGGGTFRRVRPLTDVFGFPLVDFPNTRAARLEAAVSALSAENATDTDALESHAVTASEVPSSDLKLLELLVKEGHDDPNALALIAALQELP